MDHAGLGCDGDTIAMTESKVTVPLVQLLGFPVPDFIEALPDRLNVAAGRGPMIFCDAGFRSIRLFTQTTNKGRDPRACEEVEFADACKRPELHREPRLQEASPTVHRGKAWCDEHGSAAIPSQAVDARVPGQVHSANKLTSELPPIASGGRNLWEDHSRRARVHPGIFKQIACMATETSAVAGPGTPSSVI